jgi:hypothetical protein
MTRRISMVLLMRPKNYARMSEASTLDLAAHMREPRARARVPSESFSNLSFIPICRWRRAPCRFALSPATPNDKRGSSQRGSIRQLLGFSRSKSGISPTYQIVDAFFACAAASRARVQPQMTDWVPMRG